jgi:hypothetical protein
LQLSISSGKAAADGFEDLLSDVVHDVEYASKLTLQIAVLLSLLFVLSKVDDDEDMQAPKVLLDESRLADQEFLKVAVALRMVEEIVANEDEAVALLVVVLSTLKQLHGQLELAIALKRAFLYFRH